MAAISVLLFEPPPGDIERLVCEQLHEAGYAVALERATSLDDLAAGLRRERHLLLCHGDLSELEAALALCRRQAPDTPLIVLSAAIGEEATVSLLKMGVGDVVLTSGLARLGPAVARELDEAERRRRRREERRALERSEELYRRLVESSPVVIFRYLLRPEPALEYISPAVTTVSGLSPQDFYVDPDLALRLAHPDDRPLLEHVTRSRAPTVALIRWLCGDGRTVFAELRTVPVLDGAGALVAVEGVAHDVTERELVSQAAREAEQRLRLALGAARMVAWERDPVSDELHLMAEGAAPLFGLPGREARIPFARFRALVHPDDLAAFDRTAAEHLAGNEVEMEYRLRAPDGDYRWILSRGVFVQEGESPGRPVGVCLDVTDRRRAEVELRRAYHLLRRLDGERRRLIERLVRAQEEERRRISVDIHDDTVQAMTALTLRLDLLRRQAVDPEMARALDEVADAARASIARLRHLMFELRPPSLDREGLAAALQLHLDQLRAERGLDYRFADRLSAEPDVEVRAILFRIAQEALTNVVKHARASRVDVELASTAEGILLRVADDGRGFSPPEVEEQGDLRHVGLTGMRERAEMLGGCLRIDSAPGRGTRVEVLVPAPGRSERG